MFKKNFRTSFGIAISLGLAASLFQNCGMNGFENVVFLSDSQFSLSSHEPGGYHGQINSEKVRTTYEPILADRYYLKSLLEDIFGPTASTTDSTRAYLNAIDHGSPCSVYEDHYTYNSAGTRILANPMESCGRGSGAFLVAQVNPKITVTRQALITRACSDLVTTTATLSFALKRISGSSALPEPNEENTLKLFHLFYREKPAPHPGLVESLLVMFPPDNVTREHWGSAIFTVCASGFWQVL